MCVKDSQSNPFNNPIFKLQASLNPTKKIFFHTGDGIWDGVTGYQDCEFGTVFLVFRMVICIWDGVTGWGISTGQNPEVKLEIVIDRGLGGGLYAYPLGTMFLGCVALMVIQ